MISFDEAMALLPRHIAPLEAETVAMTVNTRGQLIGVAGLTNFDGVARLGLRRRDQREDGKAKTGGDERAFQHEGSPLGFGQQRP